MASAPDGESAPPKYNITTQPAPAAVPPAYTTPEVPNIQASGAVNPTSEQVPRHHQSLKLDSALQTERCSHIHDSFLLI